MNGTLEPARSATPQDHLDAVNRLLAKRRAMEALAPRGSEGGEEGAQPALEREALAEARARLDSLHPADVAFILEGLPLEDRLVVWGLVRSDRDGEILLEVSDAVRDTLLADMDSAEMVAAAQSLDADEIADLAPDLPQAVVQDIIEAQDEEERAQLQSALSYPEGSVGALMDFETVSIRDDVTCEVALRYLRRFEALPPQTDAVFVTDREGHLKGALPLNRLLVSDLEVPVLNLIERDVISFSPDAQASEAATAFERYDLVCAPVVSSDGRVIARLTVDSVLTYVRERQEAQAFGSVGLREEEDLFSSVWTSAKNRGPWLALNLCTAFVASRVVGAFEGSIEKLAALAALMPIVAGIGGNSGNQTVALIVRALALEKVSAATARRLLAKEAGIGLLNGVLWGSVLGVVAWMLYDNVALGGVMALAMVLNLLVAALAGLLIPLSLDRFGRDPAVGSSVFLTFVTDSMGFFIFLGLATALLV